MRLCEKCHIDFDRCDCPRVEKEESIEDKIKKKEYYDMMSEKMRIDIIRHRKKNGKVL